MKHTQAFSQEKNNDFLIQCQMLKYLIDRADTVFEREDGGRCIATQP